MYWLCKTLWLETLGEFPFTSKQKSIACQISTEYIKREELYKFARDYFQKFSWLDLIAKDGFFSIVSHKVLYL